MREELAQEVHKIHVDTFLSFAAIKAVSASNDWHQRFEKLKVDQHHIQLKQAWLGTRGDKQSQYTPFCDWINHIVAFVGSPQQPSKRDLTFISLERNETPLTPGRSGGNIVDGTSQSFKPDAACVLKAEAGDFGHGSQVLVPIEFKKRDRMQQPPNLEEVELNLSATRSHHLDVTTPSSQKNERDQSDQNNELSKKEARPSAIRIRSHKTSVVAHSASSSPPSRKPTNDDIQLARYAMETLAVTGDRSHVFGLAVSRPKVTLWYFDRGGAVRSTSINVSDPGNPGFLSFVTFLTALHSSDDCDLGFLPPFTDPNEVNRSGMRRNLTEMSIKVSNHATLALQELQERRASSSRWATSVYNVQLRRDREEDNSVVIKSPQQHMQQGSRYEIPQTFDRNSEAESYLVNSFDGWDSVKDSFARSEFSPQTPLGPHDRALQFVGLKYLRPITELSQPFHIPYIGWSVLQAIKFLNAQGLFHGDISVGNIGYEYLPPCHGVIVKLRDFDLSKRIDHASGAPHWTDTLPFMSTALLQDTTQEHKVGFEVEALTWTLMWIVRVYTDGKDTTDVSNHPLQSWFSTQLGPEAIAAIKDGYLLPKTTFTNDWYSSLEPQMFDLATAWRKLISDDVDARTQVRENPTQPPPADVYKFKVYDTVKNWMEDPDRGWNLLKSPCQCEKHCVRS